MITITEKGAQKVHEFLSSQGADVSAAGLRVGVKGGGCSGFQYNLAFDSQRDGDEVFEYAGLRVYVDQPSLPYVRGSVIDYVESLQGADLADGVAATAKHMVGHGLAEGGLNQAPAHIGEREMRDEQLFPFEAASFLLLMAAVGAVVLARRRGGLVGGDDTDLQLALPRTRPAGTGTMREAGPVDPSKPTALTSPPGGPWLLMVENAAPPSAR